LADIYANSFDDVVEENLLFRKDFADALLDRILDGIGINVYWARLADPMATVTCLVLDRWVLPSVEIEDI